MHSQSNAPAPTTMTTDQLVANITQAGLDGYFGKLTADRQRAIFGANVFGRKNVDIDVAHGQVTARWAVEGLDSLFKVVSFDEITAHVNGTARLSFN